MRHAQTSVSAKDRDEFANLAKMWLSLAGDLETPDADEADSDDVTEPRLNLTDPRHMFGVSTGSD